MTNTKNTNKIVHQPYLIKHHNRDYTRQQLSSFTSAAWHLVTCIATILVFDRWTKYKFVSILLRRRRSPPSSPLHLLLFLLNTCWSLHVHTWRGFRNLHYFCWESVQCMFSTSQNHDFVIPFVVMICSTCHAAPVTSVMNLHSDSHDLKISTGVAITRSFTILTIIQ